ncbi:MAG TPA: FAD:protein FMN transferase [Steroidobacteraceae bacterium]|jgi:thiamine biosynthesis lipoprotein|nr:FAD:protein FMN transferase [Steroidobacteraceae bacterium]
MALLGPIGVEPRGSDLVAVCFSALAGHCELLLRASHLTVARELGECAAAEAWRLEEKYSRDRQDSLLSKLHARRGVPVDVDEETASLLDYAQRCHRISDGMFDITSGILRRAWAFDGTDRRPEPEAIAALLPFVGLEKIFWRPPIIELPVGMELDFCGFGRQYAVDRAFELLARRTNGPFLINFGGALRASGPPPHGCWQIGIPCMTLNIERGALATRDAPLLNPKTGWPVPHAPRSITVAAGSCAEAGLLATLALHQGARARDFLNEQGVKYWMLD